MGVSKVVLGDETLVDLTSDTVSTENLLQGATAHGADGEEVIGGVVVTPTYTGTKAAIEEAIAAGQIPEGATVNITDDEETSSFQSQINQINDSLGGITQFVVDESTGKISGYKTEIGGADTVFPFNGMTDLLFFGIFYGSKYYSHSQNIGDYGTYSGSNNTFTCTFTKDITVDLYVANSSRDGDATKTISHNGQTIYKNASHSVCELIKENYKIVSGDVITFNIVSPGASTLQWLSSIMIIK